MVPIIKRPPWRSRLPHRQLCTCVVLEEKHVIHSKFIHNLSLHPIGLYKEPSSTPNPP